MSREKKVKDSDRDLKRKQRFVNFWAKPVDVWLKHKFNFTYEDFDPAEIEGPVIVAINHASAYDPIFMGEVFKSRLLTYVASEHLFRTGLPIRLITRYHSVIPHQKGSKSKRTGLVMMKRIKRGESIFLAVEGEQTWDGVTMPIMPYSGRMIKMSGASLVTYKIEGAYLAAPRWSRSTRKGKVYGHPVKIYTPETLASMADEEIEKALADDLRFDIREWQASQPNGPISFKCKRGGNAEGIERAVCSCPACGSIGKLSSSKDLVKCSCGFSLRLDDTGRFDPPEPFETIVDWEACDRKAISERIENTEAGEEVFADEDIKLLCIGDNHDDEVIAEGRLSLIAENEDEELRLADKIFKLKEISDMSMVLASRIVFSDNEGYYELKSKDANLRKYLIAYNYRRQ
jgi:1-acyl-sn-glycerol-3-phosphate acyltransferase